MGNIYLVPSWFFGYDIVFELAFAIITLVVSIFAFRIYKLTDQRQSSLFGISFLFISISYFIQSFLNFAIISRLNEGICRVMNISSVNILNNIGIYANMFFFISGLLTLTFMTLKERSMKSYSLVVVLILLSLVFGSFKLHLFYLLASILLIYISVHYFWNYIRNRQLKTLIVFIAFIFLLSSTVHFIFSVNHSAYYVLGHFLELVAYLLILINLILVVKK